MRLNIRHITRYDFQDGVHYGLQQIRKTPKSTPLQNVVEWHTVIDGGRKELSFEDHHNNSVELVSFTPQTRHLTIISEGLVDVGESHGVLGRHRGPAPLWLYQTPTSRTQAKSGVRALVRGLPSDNDLERLYALSARIAETVTYTKGASESDWSAEESIFAAQGVCQDHAHIFVASARHMGIPARYMSGYLMLDDRTAGEAMHAWAEAHVPDLGWVGFDVSNGISPDTRYVRVATGLDYADAAPISGTRQGGTSESLTVEVHVAEQ